jgi:kinesin family member 18/19
MQLLHQGNAKRSQAATAANEVSSRSHAVLQVVVESRDKAPGVVANIKVGKLSLVDLAGSERAANTKNTGARLVEGANINRSLLALGNCINALGEKGNKGNFVPYRDSKLTRLLKDSLGGNCRTVMIANISSAESSFEETLNTLKYANRAKNIRTNAQRNVLNVNYHISEYVQLINNLRGEIQSLKDQLHSAPEVALGGGFGGPGGFDGPLGGAGMGLHIGVHSPSAGLRHPTTPLHILRESMKSGMLAEGRVDIGYSAVGLTL